MYIYIYIYIYTKRIIFTNASVSMNFHLPVLL